MFFPLEFPLWEPKCRNSDDGVLPSSARSLTAKSRWTWAAGRAAVAVPLGHVQSRADSGWSRLCRVRRAPGHSHLGWWWPTSCSTGRGRTASPGHRHGASTHLPVWPILVRTRRSCWTRTRAVCHEGGLRAPLPYFQHIPGGREDRGQGHPFLLMQCSVTVSGKPWWPGQGC